MLTYGNLITKLRPLIWPAGEAPNLVPSHDQTFIDCLDDLQTWVECLQVDHYDLLPQCATLYNCGLTMFEQPPHSMVKRLTVIDKQATLVSGAVTASKVGNLITASAAFFDASMVGTIIKFAGGNGYVVLAYIDPTKIWVADPDIITTPPPASSSSPYLYLGSHFRINQSTGLAEVLGGDGVTWQPLDGSDIEAGVPSGNGAPTFTPSGGSGLYIQKDSDPPGTLWEYYLGGWH